MEFSRLVAVHPLLIDGSFVSRNGALTQARTAATHGLACQRYALQVSGVKFQFDPSKPPGHRIDAKDVWISKEDECTRIDLDASYSIATKLYMTSGKDGFKSLQVGRHLAQLAPRTVMHLQRRMSLLSCSAQMSKWLSRHHLAPLHIMQIRYGLPL